MGGFQSGTKFAAAILLLWLAGAAFFIAFMSGQSAALTTGSDSAGNPVGPTNISSLLARLAANFQAMSVTPPSWDKPPPT